MMPFRCRTLMIIFFFFSPLLFSPLFSSFCRHIYGVDARLFRFSAIAAAYAYFIITIIDARHLFISDIAAADITLMIITDISAYFSHCHFFFFVYAADCLPPLTMPRFSFLDFVIYLMPPLIFDAFRRASPCHYALFRHIFRFSSFHFRH